LLSAKARTALDEAATSTSTVIVPAIVLAEFVMLLEKRRVALDMNDIISALESRPGFQLRNLTREVALRIQALPVLPDIHDRLIVAEALVAGAALITRDQAITALGLVQTVW
jgi:PIN domain nuclease of toxin-antitoxin system